MSKQTNKNQFEALLVPLTFGLPTVKVTTSPFVIGRSGSSDLALGQMFVSRKHLSIVRRRNMQKELQFHIQCHSAKKYFLNQARITGNKSRLLEHRNQIWLTPNHPSHLVQSVGYIFLTEFSPATLTLQLKYQRQITNIKRFFMGIRQTLLCLRCTKLMQNPINAQPCCHKFCQLCSRQMIDSEACQCPVCHVKIDSFFLDPHMIRVKETYDVYLLRQDPKIEVPSQNNDFCEIPVLSKNPSIVIVSKSEPEIRGILVDQSKPKRKERVKWGNTETFRDKSEGRVKKIQISLGSEQGNPAVIPSSVQCSACKESIRYDIKNKNRYRCLICSEIFCNVTYPPCKKGSPLKPINQWIICLTLDSFIQLVSERFQDSVKILFQRYFKPADLTYVFLYALLKEQNGRYTFRLEVGEEDFKDFTVSRQSYICESCWPGAANCLILRFLKYYRHMLPSFSRADVLEVIQYVEDRTPNKQTTAPAIPKINPQEDYLNEEDFLLMDEFD